MQDIETLKKLGNEMAAVLDKLITKFNQSGGRPDTTMLIMPADRALADWQDALKEKVVADAP